MADDPMQQARRILEMEGCDPDHEYLTMKAATAAILRALESRVIDVSGDNAYVPVDGWRRATPSESASVGEDLLATAARDVLRRWDTPNWKDTVDTASLMEKLRRALPGDGKEDA